MQNSPLFSALASTLLFARRRPGSLLGLLLSLVAVAALADPSARVGRIAYVDGDVQFRASEQSESAQASVNWPLTGGNLITTAPNARTEIRIGSSVIRLDGQSELLMTAIDDHRLALYLPYGSATVRIRNTEVAREFSLQTPQGQVSLLQPGRLRVDAGRNGPATSLQVIDGAARFDTPHSGQGGQPGSIVAAGFRLDTRLDPRLDPRLDSNNGLSQITSLRTAASDGFDGWSLARDRNDDRSQSVRYVSTETTGYEELDRNGVWRTTVEYGPVWTPTVVAADWAPYRYGRWLWVAPWGWTWVDNASWGYAPSHYGRWVSIDNRWCWTPGAVVARPVWAPAVVGWQAGVSFNQSTWAQRPPTTGWFPLAPREVYVPSYSVSRTYVERVNINHVTNITQINNFYRSRDDDRDHAHYRYRALANSITPIAAAPAPSERAKESLPQPIDGRRQGVAFMAAPGSPATRPTASNPAPVPVQTSGRRHPEEQRFEGPGEAMPDRRLIATPQGLDQPHREQMGRADHQVRSLPLAPAAPVSMPALAPAQGRSPVSVPAPAPAKALPIAPIAAPSPAQHQPPPGGRGHFEEQHAAAPAKPIPAPVAGPVQLQRPTAGLAIPATRPQHPEHRERHEARELHERGDVRQLRER